MKNLVKTVTLALAAAALVVACSPKPKPAPPPPPPADARRPRSSPWSRPPRRRRRPTPRSQEDDIKAMSLDRVSSYLKPVFFDYDKADLRSDARDVLAANATWLKSHASVAVHDRGPLRRARHRAVQPRARRPPRERREGVPRLPRRRRRPDQDRLVRQGASLRDRARRGLVGEEPPRAFRRDGEVTPRARRPARSRPRAFSRPRRAA